MCVTYNAGHYDGISSDHNVAAAVNESRHIHVYTDIKCTYVYTYIYTQIYTHVWNI